MGQQVLGQLHQIAPGVFEKHKQTMEAMNETANQ
jgi:hypothetical protein